MRQLQYLKMVVLGWMLVSGTATAHGYFGGAGTKIHPYLIFTTGDLQTLGSTSADWDKHFLLIADLDMTGQTMTPIGTDPVPFTGTFNGNEHTISNLTINLPATDYVGFFGSINCDNDEDITNLGLINVNITGDSYVGGLIGELHRAEISNCYVTGAVSGDTYVGGLLGYTWGGSAYDCYTNTTTSGDNRVGGFVGRSRATLTNCYAMGNVSGGTGGDVIGGLIGECVSGIVSYCYAGGTVSGDYTVGGLAGINKSNIDKCYATGNVTGNVGGGNASDAGGLVGLNHPHPSHQTNPFCTITRSYATGTVSGNIGVGGLLGGVYTIDVRSSYVSNSYATGAVNGYSQVGGLIGDHNPGGSIPSEVRYCYATGIVNGSTVYVGGLIGEASSLDDYTQCFWNTTTNPTLTGIGDGSDVDVIGGTTTFLQTMSSFSDPGWNFTSTWWMCGEDLMYPRLRFEVPFLDFNYSSGNGSIGNPFWISNTNQLQTLSVSELALCYWDKHFKLVTDLDMTGVAMMPIGTTNIAFTGTFDGNGHTISNLTINAPTTFHVGLFGKMDTPGSGIYDLILIEPDIAGHYNVGSLAGWLGDGEVSGCSVIEGSINGNYYVGGLVGHNDSGMVNTSSTTGTVNGTVEYAGGLAGRNQSGSSISNSYSACVVTGSNLVGGLTGYNSGAISYSYTSSAVSGSTNVGGFSGLNLNGSYTKDFWDTTVNPALNGISNSADPDVIGASTTNLQLKSTFTNAGWDFVDESINGIEDIWWICGDGGYYPLLAWEIASTNLSYGGGSGTMVDPFLISDPSHLETLSIAPCHWDKHFILIANIDMTGVVMTPIGDDTTRFTGEFDGNGYTVSNLTIDLPATDYVGLFGVTDKSGAVDPNVIYSLGLINAEMTGGESVGGLIGRNYSGVISGCYIDESSEIGGNKFVGGLVGQTGVLFLPKGGAIYHCYVTASVNGFQKNSGGLVGGLVGANYGGTIEHCWTNATVSGLEPTVGGLVGTNSSGTIIECYATGTVTGADVFVGGLAGYNYWSTIQDCYASGAVVGTDSVGGLVGESAGFSNIINCYASGVVTGTTSSVGGLVGAGFATYTKCYWSTTVNPTLTGIGDGSDPGVIGESTTTLQIRSTFTASGWDFQGESVNGSDDIWRMCVDGVDYPYLSWQYDEVGDWECPNGVNLVDFSTFAGYWLEQNCQASNDCAGTDLDLSGDVGPGDLLLWLANWLETI